MIATTKKPAFEILQSSIRASTTQFRYANDNSESLIKPESGFAYAYNIAEVESALACYKVTLGPEDVIDDEKMTQEEKIIQMGSQICANCEDDYAREFAQKVVAHFIGEELERSGQLISMIAEDSLDDPKH